MDVRVVCATNQDLQDAIREGRFREDLYYRISEITIPIPPLRERLAEIMPLAAAFLTQSAQQLGVAVPSVSPPVESLLLTCPWPGNVRELRNAMERAVVLGEGAVELEHLPDRLHNPDVMRGPGPAVPMLHERPRYRNFARAA